MSVIAYKVTQSLGDKLTEGEIVHLEEDTAAALVDAGVLSPATQEDLNGGEDVEQVESPGVVENAAKALGDKVNDAVEKATRTVAERLARNVPAPVIPASGLHIKGSDESKTWGFKSLGDFALTCVNRGDSDVHARRFSAAQKAFARSEAGQMYAAVARSKDAYGTSGGPTITATDGGVLIPPAYASELFDRTPEGVTNLYDFCTDYPYAHTTEIPINNKTSYNTGVRSYWVSEYSQGTQSAPVLDLIPMKANTLVALVPVTDQQLTENAYGLDQHIKQEVPEQAVYRKNANVLYGNGGGAAVLTNASTIVHTRATANRITFADLNNMYAKNANPSKANWYVSPSYFPELQRLSFPDASGSYPIFVPSPNGFPNISAPVPGTLHGRPVVLCDMMQALGTKGDIMFADLSSVAKVERQLDASVSVHFYYDRHSSLFRFSIRTQTVSRWLTTWTRPDGMETGPVVVLSGSSISAPTFS